MSVRAWLSACLLVTATTALADDNCEWTLHVVDMNGDPVYPATGSLPQLSKREQILWDGSCRFTLHEKYGGENLDFCVVADTGDTLLVQKVVGCHDETIRVLAPLLIEVEVPGWPESSKGMIRFLHSGLVLREYSSFGGSLRQTVYDRQDQWINQSVDIEIRRDDGYCLRATRPFTREGMVLRTPRYDLSEWLPCSPGRYVVARAPEWKGGLATATLSHSELGKLPSVTDTTGLWRFTLPSVEQWDSWVGSNVTLEIVGGGRKYLSDARFETSGVEFVVPPFSEWQETREPTHQKWVLVSELAVEEALATEKARAITGGRLELRLGKSRWGGVQLLASGGYYEYPHGHLLPTLVGVRITTLLRVPVSLSGGYAWGNTDAGVSPAGRLVRLAGEVASFGPVAVQVASVGQETYNSDWFTQVGITLGYRLTFKWRELAAGE